MVGRVRLDSQSSAGYALCYKKKLFEKCRSANENFELGQTLQGIVTDWSDAEIRGLKTVVGKKTWQRNYLKVAKCIGSDHVNVSLRKYCHHKKEAEKIRSFCKLPLNSDS